MLTFNEGFCFSLRSSGVWSSSRLISTIRLSLTVFKTACNTECTPKWTRTLTQNNKAFTVSTVQRIAHNLTADSMWSIISYLVTSLIDFLAEAGSDIVWQRIKITVFLLSVFTDGDSVLNACPNLHMPPCAIILSVV